MMSFAACGPGQRPATDGVADGGSSGTSDGGTGDGSDQAVDKCKVQEEGDDVGLCDASAPPNSFEPAVQWTWTGPGAERNSIVTPLVANLTDDNGDGAVDLCDTPDVVVVASTSSAMGPDAVGHIYVLDGLAGALKLKISVTVDATVTPAIGDIDRDGFAEIVAVDPRGALFAFDRTGGVKFGPGGLWSGERYSAAIALADLDHDGNVEIVGGNTVWDNTGVVKWVAPSTQAKWSATTIADLDNDGFLDVVLGNAAYRHDGTPLWLTDLEPGYPQVANLDADPDPEVLLTNVNGLSLIDRDGTVLYRDLRPTGVGTQTTAWTRPATIHDFDGDGRADYAMSSGQFYTLYNGDGTVKWSAPVADPSGIAAGTAFDFLGDGTVEAMYADERNMFVFGGDGQPIFSTARRSGTLSEYPVVADIDNDGSAEIVVVSNQISGETSPTVQVIRDKMDRWIQARRIWNQHTYHVTNVLEDGTIPQFEKPSWTRLNTFRTNAQINGSAVCKPPIL